MTYKISGTTLTLQPTTGKWLPRKILDIDGENRAIYEPTYSFEMTWDAISPSDFDQLRDFWVDISSTGNLSADLPGKDQSAYTFVTYSSVVVDEPESGEFFQKHLLRVRMMIRNITV